MSLYAVFAAERKAGRNGENGKYGNAFPKSDIRPHDMNV